MVPMTDSVTQLTGTQIAKREELKLKRPRVYEKQQRFDANAANGVISPTIRVAWNYLCNFRCEHCMAEERMLRNFVKIGVQDTRRRMNYDDLARFAHEADEYGLFRMVITGGEPTTWPDLFKVIEIIDPNRHLIIMDSNGWLLAERKGMVRMLAEAGVYKMQISLDSFVEKDHDCFRNKPGSFRRVMQTLPEIREAGMKLLISTCLSRGRAFTQEFEDLCQFCTGHGDLLYVTYLKPTGTGRSHEDWVIEKRDADRVRELEKKYNVITHMTPSFMHDKNAGSAHLGHYDGCITVKGINTLEHTGDIVPCPYMDWAIGNVLDEPIGVILDRGMRNKWLGPQRKDCLIGEDREFMARHNTVVEERKAKGIHHLPVPYGQGFSDADLIPES